MATNPPINNTASHSYGSLADIRTNLAKNLWENPKIRELSVCDVSYKINVIGSKIEIDRVEPTDGLGAKLRTLIACFFGRRTRDIVRNIIVKEGIVFRSRPSTQPTPNREELTNSASLEASDFFSSNIEQVIKEEGDDEDIKQSALSSFNKPKAEKGTFTETIFNKRHVCPVTGVILNQQNALMLKHANQTRYFSRLGVRLALLGRSNCSPWVKEADIHQVTRKDYISPYKGPFYVWGNMGQFRPY